MLEKAKSLLQPSARSDVPPFMVMDVMAAAARLEAQGRRIVHMEVGQPAAGAPATAIAAVRAALSNGPHGYTETLGIASLRRRIARAYREWHGLDIDPERIVVTTGSSAGFMLAFLAAFEPGDRVAVALPGYPPYRHILTALGCEPVWIETSAADALVDHQRKPARRSIACGRSRAWWSASPANPTGTMMTAAGARGVDPLRRRCRHRRHIGRDLSRPRLCLCRRERRALFVRYDHHQLVFQIFLHDRMADRLDGGAAVAGACDRAVAAEPRDLGADVVADRRRGRLRRPRGIGRDQAWLPGKSPHPA